jgi:hypothetical protein
LPSRNEDNDDEENEDRKVLEIEIVDESAVPPMITLKRVVRFHYMHIGEVLNSPLCKTFSDAGTIYEPETV